VTEPRKKMALNFCPQYNVQSFLNGQEPASFVKKESVPQGWLIIHFRCIRLENLKTRVHLK
jgi:hypothetical protein